MLDARAGLRLLALSVIALGACDRGPAPDGGPVEVDGGSDAGPLEADAGPDASEPGDCQGPPGLYMAGSCDMLAVGVRAYRPRYALWSDGADKERFVYLPPGTRIDTADPNNWVYPRGTRIYKTFSHAGVRLETRLLEKHSNDTGPNAWYMRTFAWNAAQDRVTEVTEADISLRENVLGTDHDIPNGPQCVECHSGPLDVVNSFSAIQLNHDDGSLTLQMLLGEGLLTVPFDESDARVPGTPTEAAALGYLHANCGNCHRATPSASSPDACRTAACASGLHLWVNTGLDTVGETTTYETAVAVRHTYFHADMPADSRCRVHPGEPELSVVHFRMAHPRGDSAQMPPLGTELNHAEGIATVAAWISALTMPDTPCLP